MVGGGFGGPWGGEVRVSEEERRSVAEGAGPEEEEVED